MSSADVALLAGAFVILGLVGLLVVVMRATARTAENAREILVALEEIHASTSTLDQLHGAAQASDRTSAQLPGSTSQGNGSGAGTEVPS